MNSEKYIVLYGNKKMEDILILKKMFNKTEQISLGWTEVDFINNMKIINKAIKENIQQIIFWGLEIGWDKLIETVREKNNSVKIKVICNTNDSLLYYDYERNNFFKMLELSKRKIIDKIGFFRKGQYITYKKLGYNCCLLKENYNIELDNKINLNKTNNKYSMEIGIYPLNYTWDKNIFNQLCIPKFIDDSNLNYNCLDPRMTDFLNTMKIKSNIDNIKEINERSITDLIKKNDVIISTSFTEYVHPIFFISMELGIPCLIGNNSDFFEENEELVDYIVTKAEDNPITNSIMVMNIVKNKKKIFELYKKWKEKYNIMSKEAINLFLND